MSVAEVSGLRVELTASHDDVVDGLSIDVDAGEIVGIVGESGSGKTTLGTALLGFARRGASIAGGLIRVDGTEILGLSEEGLRSARGRIVAYIPQDPATALNPSVRLGAQLGEALEVHGIGGDAAGRRARIAEVLDEVRLPATDEFLARYPHQISGGQQQRVCIAMAFACTPRLVVLDEPTTGLDVSTQAHVLATVKRMCTSRGVAALYVTHDLAVISNLADRVMVMYAGRLAELGPRDALFERPAHPYTKRLLAAIPDVDERSAVEPIRGAAPPPSARPAGCFFAPRCDHRIEACTTGEPPVIEIGAGHVARCLRAQDIAAAPFVRTPVPRPAISPEAPVVLDAAEVCAFHGSTQILHDVALSLTRGECLAVVGESGSGKTTFSRCVIGLHANRTGTISYQGAPLAPLARDRPTAVRKELQYIFQSPYNSLNPRRTVGETVALPVEEFQRLHGSAAREVVSRALDRVALSTRMINRYPDQLSGGERQRVAIARALVCEPEVLICDEITSALDVSVQAAIVDLLEDLRREMNLSMIFVTHNLALVRLVADRVAVLNHGRIEEVGCTADVLDRPSSDYTRGLLADTPRIPRVSDTPEAATP